MSTSKCGFCPPHCEACKGPGRCECHELVDGHGQLPGGADLLSERDALAATVEALADQWEANGNSRELGDPTDLVWFKCAVQLRAVVRAVELSRFARD